MMKLFSEENVDYKSHVAYIAFKRFFDSYLLERDFEKTLALIDDDFYSLGTGCNQFAVNKEQFSELLKRELEILPEPIEYSVNSICGKEVVENVWNIMAFMEIKLPRGDGEKISYIIRFTGCFVLFGDDVIVTSMHMSEVSNVTEDKTLMSLKYASNNEFIDKGKTEQIIFDIMSNFMPGGIVSGYAEEGFPLYFVNEQYLELLGYSTYDEYYQAAGGLGITHIHPDDREIVNRETMNSYSEDTQCAIEYRIQHKDGYYIYVYDIRKKTITHDGKEVVICVLYDMTEDMKLKELLIRESNHDWLTGLYNRRGLERKLKELFENFESLGHSAMIMVDADGLKEINDTYGHDKGDVYLKKISSIINGFGMDNSLPARIGGDEFVLFLYGYDSEAELISTIEILQHAQNHSTIRLDENTNVLLRFSLGYSMTGAVTDYNKLIKEADVRMYENKLERKRQWV